VLAYHWLRKAGYRAKPAGLADPELKLVAGLAIPAVLFLSVQSLFLGSAERYLLSTLTVGSIAATAYAQRLMMSVGGISFAIQTSAFKSMVSSSVPAENYNSLSDSIDLGMFVLWPLSLFLSFFAEPIVTVLFQFGQFDQTSASMTARALRWYALSVPAGFVFGVTSRACYAFLSPSISVAMSVVFASVTLLTDVLLLKTFAFEAIPIGFLAGNSAVAAMGLLICYKKGWCLRFSRVIASAAAQCLIASVGIILIELCCYNDGWNLDRQALVIRLVCYGLLYGLGYFSLSLAIGSGPTRQVYAAGWSVCKKVMERWHISGT
jgi:putative peptidoglycan lipid II flippase